MDCLKARSSMFGRIRSWSSSHGLIGVGGGSRGSSKHSSSTESGEAFRRIRLQQIFFRSVIQNDQAMVIRCLHHGADVAEEYTPHYQTVLHESAKRGLLRMTELLLRAGANPNVVDEKAFLPLHYACQEGHFNTVRCLLIYGSMVTIENEYGDAPLHTAVRYGHSALLPLLLSVDLRRDFDRRRIPDRYHGVDHLNLQNANGDTALHIAAALDRKAIVKRLLQWAADPSLVNHQDLTPLQVAIEKQRPAVIRLLRHPPLIVLERPFGLLAINPTQQQQQQGGKNYLQRYTDEVNRHRMEHEGLNGGSRSYMEPIMPAGKAMSTESLSQTSRGQYHRGVTSVPSLSPPGSSASGGHIVRGSQFGGSSRRISSPNQLGIYPTKIVGLDAQPNNVNKELDGGPRLQQSQLYQQHQHYYGGLVHGHGIGSANGHSAAAATSATSMKDLSTVAGGNLLGGPGADVLFGDGGVGIARSNGHLEHKIDQKVDRRLDALSLEVDNKLRSLRSQYAQMEAAGGRAGGHRRDQQELRKSARPSISTKSDKSKKKSSSSSSTTTTTKKSSKISVTYENGRITNLSTNGDALIKDSGFVPIQNGGGGGSSRRRRSPTKSPPPPSSRSAATSPTRRVTSPPPPQVTGAAPTPDETDRRMSHTYYVPPAPKAPPPMSQHNNGAEDEHVIVVRELNDSNRPADLDGGGNIRTSKEMREAEQDIFLNTRVTEFHDGEKVIRQAPTLTDVYGLRVGRVSPRIRSIQDRLRRSHYRNSNYNYALYDDAGYGGGEGDDDPMGGSGGGGSEEL